MTSLGNRFPTFRRIVLPLQRWTFEKNGFFSEPRPAQMKALCSFEQLGVAYTVMSHRTPDERILQTNRCSAVLEISWIWGGGGGNIVTFPVQDSHSLVLLLSQINPAHIAQSSIPLMLSTRLRLGLQSCLFLWGYIHKFCNIHTYTRWRSWLRHCARGFDSRWCHWNFHWHIPSCRTMALGLTQLLAEMAIRNISGSKGDRCVGLTTLPTSYVDRLDIWEFQPPGTPRLCPGL